MDPNSLSSMGARPELRSVSDLGPGTMFLKLTQGTVLWNGLGSHITMVPKENLETFFKVGVSVFHEKHAAP